MIADWPQRSGIDVDPVAAQRITDMQKLVTEIRRFRSDQGLADRQKVPARLSGIDAADLSTQVGAITSLAWLTEPGRSSARRHRWRSGCKGGHRRRRTGHLGHHRRRRRASPPGEGSWPPRKRNWLPPQRNWATPTSWPRRRPPSSTSSESVSEWRARKPTGSRPGWPDSSDPGTGRRGIHRRGSHPGRDRGAVAGRAPARPALAGNQDRAQPDPHLGADGSARLTATRLPVDPYRRHQRQNVGGADGRCAADCSATAYRPDHQPASAVGGRAHRDRRKADQPGAHMWRPTPNSSRSCRWSTSSRKTTAVRR